jgi:signal transduction histidine kinase
MMRSTSIAGRPAPPLASPGSPGVEGVPLPLLVVDAECRVLAASPAAVRLFALPPETAAIPLGAFELGRRNPDLVAAIARALEGRVEYATACPAAGPVDPVALTIVPLQEGRIVRGVALWAMEPRSAEPSPPLVAAEIEREAFLALLAHELRAPLAPMMNALAVLRRCHGEDGAPDEMAVIERQLRRLARLLDEILDLTRASHGKIQLTRAPVDARVVVANAVETVRPLIDEGGHRLRVATPGRPVMVMADASRLEQVLVNLLTNAAKYTPPGGTIEVTLEREGDDVVMVVRDDGVGIPPALLPRVFDLFVQGGGAPGPPQGLGLGLTLARRLAELHGGTVEARSDGPGRGAAFIVRLPA